MNHPPIDATEADILIVDDDEGQRSLLSVFLKGQGFRVQSAASGEEALRILGDRHFDMMITDVRMPGMSGLDALREARGDKPDLSVLLVTAYADVRDAVEAMRDGAVNYLEKPIDLDELLDCVHRALGHQPEGISLPGGSLPELPEGMIVKSPEMMAAVREALLVAPSESRVLITGESGVGKEVLANLIHARSPRSHKPFAKVNCAAIPSELLESELFGHEKGAFTGATQQRAGRFEDADEGTILLDEVAEMTPALQAKLLRVVQDGSFQRVGSNSERHSSVRILATTNRNLEEEVAAGRFREDLFFRLNVVEIYVPPLRERRKDILALANYYTTRFATTPARLSPAFAAILEVYDWPGNVRELRNAIERATLMARGGGLLPEHLPNRIQKHVALQKADGRHEDQEDLGGKMEQVERVVILQALRDNDYNRTRTARALGISRRTLLYRLSRLREQGYQIADNNE